MWLSNKGSMVSNICGSTSKSNDQGQSCQMPTRHWEKKGGSIFGLAHGSLHKNNPIFNTTPKY